MTMFGYLRLRTAPAHNMREWSSFRNRRSIGPIVRIAGFLLRRPALAQVWDEPQEII
jgi:hypothetical protein